MRMCKTRLSMAVAVTFTIAMLAAPAMAQMQGVVTAGGGVLTTDVAGNVSIATGGANQVVTWSDFTMKGKFLAYTGVAAPGNNFLNKVAAGKLAWMDGPITTSAAANVYFFAPGGILISKGFTVNAAGGKFVAAAQAWTGTDAAFVAGPGVEYSVNAKATPSLQLTNAALTINDSIHGGTESNLWLIGTEYANAWTKGYTVGASWMTGKEANAYKNVATLTVTGAGGLEISSGELGKMWLGKIDAVGPVTLKGLQIWLPSVKASTFTALGGTDASKLWNAGVWVYGEIPNPLAYPTGAKYTGTNAIETTTGDVAINGVWNWVSAKIKAAGDVLIGRAAAGTPDNALSVWLLDVETTGAGKNVKLFADATSGSTLGGVWVNSIKTTATGAFSAISKGDFVTWLGYNVAGATNAAGITDSGGNITTVAALQAKVTAPRGMMRGTTPPLAFGGFPVQDGNYYTY
jgi:filamentous hemagglutinin family protein